MNLSQNKICWNFPVEQSGKYSAFNNHDLERFKKGRYKSLTREVIQNSIDAKDTNNSEPTVVHFQLLELPITQFPDLEGFKQKLAGCIRMAPRDGSSEAAIDWFENARKVVNDEKVYVLKMSDYNTVGMAGPCVLGKPFFSFIKAMGNPTKLDETAAGGHGIGKRAPLLSSKLRSLVASTCYQDAVGKRHFLAQGFSLLISHEEKRPEVTKPVMVSHEGYWGYPEGCMPIEDICEVPEFFRRGDIGTDVFLLGFDRARNWEHKIIAHALTNFFAAFARGTLDFHVGGLRVNQANVSEWFFKVNILLESLDDEQEKEGLINASHFFNAINGDGTPPHFVESRQIKELGEVQITIMVSEGLPQELCLIRKNMLILNHFPGIKQFRNYKDFVAVVECSSKRGERLIRSIEPSRHDSLEIDQLEKEEDRVFARNALKKFAAKIREAIKLHALDNNNRAGSVDFLSQFFADEDTNGLYEAGDRDPRGRVDIKPRKLKVFPSGSPAPSGPEVLPPTPEPEPNPNPPNPVPPPPNTPGLIMNLAKQIRVIEKSDGSHRLAFDLDDSGRFNVSLYAVGLESELRLDIVKSSIGKVSKGELTIESAQPSQRFVADVSLARSSTGAYRVVCRKVES